MMRILLFFVIQSVSFALFAQLKTPPTREEPGGDPPPITHKTLTKIRHDALEFKGDEAWHKGKPFTGISYTFWPDNRINEQFSWVNGKREGTYKEFTETGTLVTAVTWYQGEKHGPYQYNYFTGAVQSSGNFAHNELHGLIYGWYSTGIKKYEVTYENGVRNGPSRTWFKNGAPEQIAFYVNDLPHGEVFEYYQDSLLWAESEFQMGVRHGRYYQFHRNSGCAAVESYFKNGLLDSIRRVWSEINCGLIEEEHYLLGKKHGEFVLYDLNGDTLTVKNYLHGVLHGEFRQYHTKTTADVNEGVVSKYQREYGLDAIGLYENGKKNGYWKFGMSSHYQHREGNYVDDVMTGKWVFYDLKGRILMIHWYNDSGDLEKEKRYRRPRKA